MFPLALALTMLFPSPALFPPPPGGTDWYADGYNRALRDARVSEQLVMVALLPEWSDYSNRVAEETFGDPRVAEACADLIAVKQSADDAALASLSRLFNIEDYPAIVFVDARGNVEDLIEGFIPADAMLEQLARITAGIGTVSAHQADVDRDPEDSLARWTLLDMLRNVRDEKRAAKLEAAIRADDPDAQTFAGARLAREALWEAAYAHLEHDGDAPDDSALVAHVESRADPAVRRDGWFEIGNARAGREDMAGAREAFHVAWLECDEAVAGRVGASLVHFLMSDEQGELSRDEREWALSMARTAVELAEVRCERAKDDALALDGDGADGAKDGDGGWSPEQQLAENLGLLARAQSMFAPERERKHLAVATAQRCVELAPEEEGYRHLLEEMLALN